MKNHKYIIAACCIIMIQSVYAQVQAAGGATLSVTPATTHNSDVSHPAVPPTVSQYGHFAIQDMKSRGIIVRLNTHKRRIDNYRQAGYTKIADELEAKTQFENDQLIRAFVLEFTFCPLYFMYAEHTAMLEHDTLIALSQSLDRDTIIRINPDTFWVIDYGEWMQNVMASSNSTMKEGWRDVARTAPSQTPSAQSNGLVIKDAHLQQLQAPFPYLTTVTTVTKFDVLQSYIPFMGLFARTDKVIFTTPVDSMFDAGFMDYIHRKVAYMEANDPKNYPNQVEDDRYAMRYMSLLDKEAMAKKVSPFQVGVRTLNEKLIAYYSKVLGKERNIDYNTSNIYWWKRNRNIAYLPSLSRVDARLYSYYKKNPRFIQKD